MIAQEADDALVGATTHQVPHPLGLSRTSAEQHVRPTDEVHDKVKLVKHHGALGASFDQEGHDARATSAVPGFARAAHKVLPSALRRELIDRLIVGGNFDFHKTSCGWVDGCQLWEHGTLKPNPRETLDGRRA
nr:MAG TPA: hypothetical protein [Bacteriophage sp.]